MLTIYFVRGGLPVPRVQGDFRLDDWTPFVAKNMNTGQIIPMAPLPTLVPPKIGGVGCGIALLALGAVGLLMALDALGKKGGAADAVPMFVIYTLFLVLPGIFLIWIRPASKRSQWERDFEAAKHFASAGPL
jgi:hypothetical protein